LRSNGPHFVVGCLAFLREAAAMRLVLNPVLWQITGQRIG
jgi:hypothetical protein